MNNRQPAWRRLSRVSFLVPLLLLVIAVGVNLFLQPSLFQTRVLSGNLRVFLPLILLAASQAIIILGGGIDLSSGAIVSMVNTVVVSSFAAQAGEGNMALALLYGLGAGLLAGAFNGIGVAFLRLQPIVTTYASSFVFGGIALWVLPRPGGQVPQPLVALYRSAPLGFPFPLLVIVALILAWIALRSTRFGAYLFATGGAPRAAYTTGVPVDWIRFSTYALGGVLAGFSAIALTLSTTTGDPNIGGARMTLDSIVAVVLGGTALSGGQGGLAGSVIGVLILGIIRNIISFGGVSTWSETLVDALIILAALTAPGLVRLVRGKFFS